MNILKMSRVDERTPSLKHEVRCPPADQPVTMMGPWMPCSPALASSQSKALFSSLVICVRLASGARV